MTDFYVDETRLSELLGPGERRLDFPPLQRRRIVDRMLYQVLAFQRALTARIGQVIESSGCAKTCACVGGVYAPPVEDEFLDFRRSMVVGTSIKRDGDGIRVLSLTSIEYEVDIPVDLKVYKNGTCEPRATAREFANSADDWESDDFTIRPPRPPRPQAPRSPR